MRGWNRSDDSSGGSAVGSVVVGGYSGGPVIVVVEGLIELAVVSVDVGVELFYFGWRLQ